MKTYEYPGLPNLQIQYKEQEVKICRLRFFVVLGTCVRGDFFKKFLFVLFLALIACVIKRASAFYSFFCVEHAGAICLCQKKLRMSVNRD